MKLSIALVFCFVVAVALALTPEESRQKFKAARDKCHSNPATAVDEAEVKRFRESKGKGPKPANSGPASLCIAKELHWINDDGSSLSTDEFRSRLSAAYPDDSAKVDAIVSECAVDKGSPEANAENLIVCFFKHNAPPRPAH